MEPSKRDNPAEINDTSRSFQIKLRALWHKIWRWEYTGLLVIILITIGFHFAAINRPTSIVWDEKWYVGDVRSIITGGGDVRPEHPALGKLFILAGEYIFNGFKIPEKDTGETILYPIGTAEQTVINVNDVSSFKTGQTIKIDREHLNIIYVNYENKQITVQRDVGGTGVSSHAAGAEIYVFTDNAFGWRFFSIVFGTLGIIIFYFICRKLKFSLRATLIATFLFAFENMTYLHAGLALLDIYMVTFMLAAVLLYLDEKYLLSGVFIALSAQCKLAGVLIIFALFSHFVIYRRDKWIPLLSSLLLAGFSYIFFTFIFELMITGGVVNPAERISAMLSGTAANVFTDPKLSISSYPWTWIYPQFVQVYYNSPNVPFIVYSYDPQYISFISSTIQILIIPTIGYMVYKTIKGNHIAALVVLWFLATYVIWIPLTMATNRVTFVFYFLPTTPAVILGIAMAIEDMLDWLKARRERRGRMTPGIWIWYSVIGLYLLIHLAIFIVFNPAIPTIIKTWLPPFAIGVSPSVSSYGLMALVNFLK